MKKKFEILDLTDKSSLGIKGVSVAAKSGVIESRTLKDIITKFNLLKEKIKYYLNGLG